ncbi:hypothetical protein Tco_0582896 [Tanacetum coccineum]
MLVRSAHVKCEKHIERLKTRTATVTEDEVLGIAKFGFRLQLQEEAGVQLNAEQADWKGCPDDEFKNRNWKDILCYMHRFMRLPPEFSGQLWDQSLMMSQCIREQGESIYTIDSSDICYDRAQDDQDETDDLDQERDLLASLIQKLKCEIDDSKNRNKFLESSNKELVDKLKGEIEDFKTKNKSLESSNNHFKEANNELSKVTIDCAKAKGDLMSYKIDFEKSSNAYTQKINDLNQTISDMKKELCAHQETISIMSQAKEAQIKLYKTREDKELDKVIALENKVKVLNDIVYKTGQSVQTMNMLNRNCKTSFAKPEFLKKAQRANPRLYDIGCYNDNLALMLAPESDESIQLANKCSTLKSSTGTQKTQFLNESTDFRILLADHMNAILGIYTDLDEVTNLQCDYLETWEKCEHLEKEISKSRTMSKSFEALQKHAINLNLIRKPLQSGLTVKKFRNTTRKIYEQIVEIILKFLGTVKFGNDQITPILGYGDLVQGTITIKRVYYVEGLNHNLFSVGQFCDADLEVAFRKSTCYIRDLKGNDLLTGSRGTDLYSISLQDSTTPNPICLMAKATSSQAWLWHIVFFI